MVANLIKVACLVIWDKALIAHRRCFKTLDRTFRDILSSEDTSFLDIPFGGKVFAFGGDLR